MKEDLYLADYVPDLMFATSLPFRNSKKIQKNAYFRE